MTRRRRIRRLWHRFGGVLCAVFVDVGPTLTQSDVDAAVERWCKRNP